MANDWIPQLNLFSQLINVFFSQSILTKINFWYAIECEKNPMESLLLLGSFNARW